MRQAKPRKVYLRERGYTDAEALALPKICRSYEPRPDQFGNIRESDGMVQTKRWVPLLCAFTGARVAEITQLRKEDFRQEDGQWVMRIMPEAGTVKSGGYRDMPLHPQVIAEGLIKLLENAKVGALFRSATCLTSALMGPNSAIC